MHSAKREMMDTRSNLKYAGVTDIWANDSNVVTCGAGVLLSINMCMLVIMYSKPEVSSHVCMPFLSCRWNC